MSNETEVVEILAKPERADANQSQYKAKFEKAILGSRDGIHYITLLFRDAEKNEETSRTWSATKVDGLYEIAGDEMVTTASQTSLLSMLDHFGGKVSLDDFQRMREHLGLSASQTREAARKTLK